MSQDKSYKDSLKATSLFGGVQLYNILIGIIRSKFTALLLGPYGMGITGLYTSATGLINAISGLGIGSSAVKNIAEANASGDQERIVKVISVFRKLVWITGLLGAVFCLVLAPWLSQLSFGNKDYTVGFIILSCTLLFKQLTTGQNTLMQGLHKYAYMAKANVIGSTIGLFITVPLYYIWGKTAIVPVLVIAELTSMILAYFFSKKLEIKSAPVSANELKSEGTNMVVMGIMISLGSLLSLAASYLIRIFISNTGGLDDVGLYNAGFAIVNTYVGMVFTAMGTDYYPRLSEVNHDEKAFGNLINNQIEIALFIIAPIIVAFIVFIRPVVVLLYSDKFISIEGMVYWAILGIFFKATSWAIAFSYLAKGDSKAFFYNETLSVIYVTVLNVLFYKYWGLTGIGLSFLIGYVIYAIQVWLICGRRYHITLRSSVFKIYLSQLPIAIICLLLVKFTSPIVYYSASTLLLLTSLAVSFVGLDKRIGLKEIIRRRINRN